MPQLTVLGAEIRRRGDIRMVEAGIVLIPRVRLNWRRAERSERVGRRIRSARFVSLRSLNDPGADKNVPLAASGASSVRHIREGNRAIDGVQAQHPAGEGLDRFVRPIASVELGEHDFASRVCDGCRHQFDPVVSAGR